MKTAAFTALSKLGDQGPDLADCARIMSVWEAIVGANLSRHLVPARLERRELTVDASSNSWLSEARFLEEAILGNIARELPGVRVEKVRFRLARKRQMAYLDRRTLTTPERPAGPRIEGVDLPAEDEDEIERTVARLEDGSLRESLRRVLRLARRAERAREGKDKA